MELDDICPFDLAQVGAGASFVDTKERLQVVKGAPVHIK